MGFYTPAWSSHWMPGVCRKGVWPWAKQHSRMGLICEPLATGGLSILILRLVLDTTILLILIKNKCVSQPGLMDSDGHRSMDKAEFQRQGLAVSIGDLYCPSPGSSSRDGCGGHFSLVPGSFPIMQSKFCAPGPSSPAGVWAPM